MTTSPLFKRVPAEPTREMCEAMPVLPALTQDDLRFKALGWPMHAIQNRHRLVAALAASPEPPAEEVETGWQPIETAPTGDDDFFLVCGAGDDRPPFVVRGAILKSARQTNTPSHLHLHWLTHWMPLPGKPGARR